MGSIGESRSVVTIVPALLLAAGLALMGSGSAARAQSLCPDQFTAAADAGETLTCTCSPEATQAGSVWGTDSYTADSSVCRAALHAGVVTRRGGEVTVAASPGQPRYFGVTRNGIASSNFGAYERSFTFPAAVRAATPPCPDNFAAFAEDDAPHSCTCEAMAATRGSIWGTDVYTADSSVCRAALHAGAIRRDGGAVVVAPRPGRQVYPGTTRNGIVSNNHPAYTLSFAFEGTRTAQAAPQAPPAENQSQAQAPADQAPPAPAPAPAPQAAPLVPATPDQVCPDNFAAYAHTTETVACFCTPEATQAGSVWGSDAYTADSAVCRAALHAGIVTRRGGPVVVTAQQGQPRYIGVTRNGVTSVTFGAYETSFVFPAARRTETPLCPDNYTAFAADDAPYRCSCDALAATRGSVWGTDTYTADSAVCRAALHAGMIARDGGTVVVVPRPGRPSYPGTTRFGVASANFGAYQLSFGFEGTPRAAAPRPSGETLAAGQVCPDNFAAFDETREPVACVCRPEAMQGGAVWGSDVYTGDSAVCRAALHAGVVGPQGGDVTVLPEPGRQLYPGVTRNGVTSSNFGPYRASFRFRAPARPVVVDNRPAQAPVASSLRERGQVELYIQFRTDSAEIEQAAYGTLLELKQALDDDRSLRLVLVGHTDSVGAPRYNLDLSRRRAQSVATWLIQQGVPRARLAVDGKGLTQPIADNGTDEGRALNRRVQAVRIR